MKLPDFSREGVGRNRAIPRHKFLTGVLDATPTVATAATATAATSVMPTITIIMVIVVAMVM